jgi:GTP cyclohydrolase II
LAFLASTCSHNTYQANTSVGLPEISRDFGDGAVVLKFPLDDGPIRSLSNNSDKRTQLEQAGHEVATTESLIDGVCAHNLRYIRAQRAKGHMISDEI